MVAVREREKERERRRRRRAKVLKSFVLEVFVSRTNSAAAAAADRRNKSLLDYWVCWVVCLWELGKHFLRLPISFSWQRFSFWVYNSNNGDDDECWCLANSLCSSGLLPKNSHQAADEFVVVRSCDVLWKTQIFASWKWNCLLSLR